MQTCNGTDIYEDRLSTCVPADQADCTSTFSHFKTTFLDIFKNKTIVKQFFWIFHNYNTFRNLQG